MYTCINVELFDPLKPYIKWFGLFKCLLVLSYLPKRCPVYSWTTQYESSILKILK